MLAGGLCQKLADAFAKVAFKNHVGSGTIGGTNPFTLDRRPFS
jgi:hypothetical protein